MAENRTYTEADLAEKQREWERGRVLGDLVQHVSQIQGQLSVMPGAMEIVARKVVTEVMAEQRAQNTEHRAATAARHWAQAPVVIQFAQLVVPVLAIAIAYLIGKGII